VVVTATPLGLAGPQAQGLGGDLLAVGARADARLGMKPLLSPQAKQEISRVLGPQRPGIREIDRHLGRPVGEAGGDRVLELRPLAKIEGRQLTDLTCYDPMKLRSMGP
jgi:hypothetical protein